jgi:hypothetical protein
MPVGADHLFVRTVLYRVIAAGFAMAFSAATIPVRAQTMPASEPTGMLPDQIKKALDTEAAALGPSISVQWSGQMDPPLTSDRFKVATGLKKFDRKKTFTQLDDGSTTWCADGRFLSIYNQSFAPSGTNRIIHRFKAEHSYDGKLFYFHTANPGEIHLIGRRDINYEAQHEDDEVFDAEYFQDIGLPLPITASQVQRHAPLTPEILQTLSSPDTRLAAVENVQLSGAPAVLLRIIRGPQAARLPGGDEDHVQGTDEFYLDPARGCVQLRHEHRDPDGSLGYRIDSSDIEAFPARSLFLPKTVVASESTWDRREVSTVTETITISRVDFTPLPSDRFTLKDSTPGTWVIEHVGSSAKKWIVRKDGSLRPLPHFHDPAENTEPATQQSSQHGGRETVSTEP